MPATTTVAITEEKIATFRADGFVVVDQIIDPRIAAEVADRYSDLFAGTFETGLLPDEWNWKPGRDPEDRTRQICNAWKSDRLIASVVLDPAIGRACAALGGWTGTRLSQDNVLWKPPGAKALGYHQDSSYEQWADPPDWVSCWIALDDTTAEGGTVEYVRGSHLWPHSGMIEQFHAPANYRKELDEAARDAGVAEPEIVKIVVPRGGGVFHQGWTWHGSGINKGERPRRSLVAHCMSARTKFHPTITGAIYSRYKRFDDLTMDESFFPITWESEGGRSAFIDSYLAAERGWAGHGVAESGTSLNGTSPNGTSR
jgi:ectoine hydroxylase-related dioxygenase (phytanoyl-CoA dioxygenase family)